MTGVRRVLLVLFAVSTVAMASPVDEWHKALDQVNGAYNSAVSQLNNAKGSLNNIDRALDGAQKELSRNSGALNQVQGELNRVQSELKQRYAEIASGAAALGNINNLKGSEQAAIDSLVRQRDALVAQGNDLAQRIRQARDNALGTKLLAYSLTTKGDFTYNFKTGSFFAQAELGNGVSVDSKKIENYLSGTVAIPDVNPVEFAISSAGLKVKHTTSYNAARAQFFAEHNPALSYFSSERFVDWASAETLAHHVALAIITEGESTNQSMREVQDRLYLEFNDIYAWLVRAGVSDLENTATCALQSLMGESCQGGSESLAAVLETVGCQYAAQTDWRTELPLSILGNLNLGSPTVNMPSSHVAFGLQLPGRSSGFEDALTELESMPESGDVQRLFVTVVQKLLGSQSAKAAQYFSDLDASSLAARAQSQLLSTQWFNQNGVTVDMVRSKIQAGNPIVDLRDTQAAAYMAERLKALAQGNERAVSFDKLELDLSTMTLSASITMRHQQSWGSVSDAINAVNDWYHSTGRNMDASVDSFVQQGAGAAVEQMENAEQGVQRDLGQVNSSLSQAGERINALMGQFNQAVQADSIRREAVKSVQQQGSAFIGQLNQLQGVVTQCQNTVNQLVKQRDEIVKTISDLEAQMNSLAAQASQLRNQIASWIPNVNIPIPHPSLPRLPSIPRPHLPW